MTAAPDLGGRPPKIDESRSLRVRLEREHVVALDLLADLRDASRNDLIREAVIGLLTADPEEGTA